MPSYELRKLNDETKEWEPLEQREKLERWLRRYHIHDFKRVVANLRSGRWAPNIYSFKADTIWVEQGIYKVAVTDTANATDVAEHHLKYGEVKDKIRITQSEHPWSDQDWYKLATDKPQLEFTVPSDPTLIGYYETEEDCALLNDKTMKVGRYLNKFFDIDHDTVEAMCQEYAKLHNVEWEILTASADIAQAYMNGPDSCMSFNTRSYKTEGIHPTEVYGGDSDLDLLIVKRNNRITGRVLVWQEHKTYGEIYGDKARVSKVLNDLSYTAEHGFEGARINKIGVHSNCYVMPYIDDYWSVNDQGNYFTIAHHGCIEADSTNGISGEVYYCECTGEHFPEDQVTYVADYGYVSEDALTENFVYADNAECWVQIDNATEVITQLRPYEQTEYRIDNRWASLNAFYCDATDRYYDESLEMVVMHDGDVWCMDHFEDNGFICPVDGEAYPNSMGIYSEQHKSFVSADNYEDEPELELEAA